MIRDSVYRAIKRREKFQSPKSRKTRWIECGMLWGYGGHADDPDRTSAKGLEERARNDGGAQQRGSKAPKLCCSGVFSSAGSKEEIVSWEVPGVLPAYVDG